MFNQEHGAGKGKAAAACPNLHTLSSLDGGNSCSGPVHPHGHEPGWHGKGGGPPGQAEGREDSSCQLLLLAL